MRTGDCGDCGNYAIALKRHLGQGELYRIEEWTGNGVVRFQHVILVDNRPAG